MAVGKDQKGTYEPFELVHPKTTTDTSIKKKKKEKNKNYILNVKTKIDSMSYPRLPYLLE